MKNILVLLVLILSGSISYADLPTEDINVIVTVPPNAVTRDHKLYYVVASSPLHPDALIELTPMTEEIASTLEKLSSGKHVCAGRRQRGNVFALSCN